MPTLFCQLPGSTMLQQIPVGLTMTPRLAKAVTFLFHAMSENIFRSEHPAAPARGKLGLMGSFAVVWTAVLFLLAARGGLAALWSVALGLGVGGYAVCRQLLSDARTRHNQRYWAEISTASRVWMLQVLGFVPTESVAAAAARGATFPRQQQLLYRHVAWVRALGLPRNSTAGQREAALFSFLEAAELDEVRASPKPLELLLDQQAAALQCLHQGDGLPEPQLAALLGTMRRLKRLHCAWEDSQGPKRGWGERAIRIQILFPGLSRWTSDAPPDYSAKAAQAIEAEVLELVSSSLAAAKGESVQIH